MKGTVDTIMQRIKTFVIIAEAPAYETATAIAKAKRRKLLSDEDYSLSKEKLSYYYKLINPYIKSIGKDKGKDDSLELNEPLP